MYTCLGRSSFAEFQVGFKIIFRICADFHLSQFPEEDWWRTGDQFVVFYMTVLSTSEVLESNV